MNVSKSLLIVAKRLNQLGIPWRLFASGALMVWGVEINPKDLDIFVSAKDVVSLEKIFKEYVVNPLHTFKEKDKEYLEFQMQIDGVEIEICELEDLGKIEFVDYGGEKIPVAPLQEIRDEYRANSPFQDCLPLIQKRIDELKQRKLI